MDEEEEEREAALLQIDGTRLAAQLPKNNWRSVLLRFAISLVFLGLLFWRLPDVSLGDVIPEITSAAILWVLVAVLVHLVAYALQTVRWSTVSNTLGIGLPFKRMFSLLLAGEFVSNALPTSFGGDVVRVRRQGQATGDYADAFAGTALERLTGWLVLPVLSTAAMLIHPEFLQLGTASFVAVAINVSTVVALIAILWAAGHKRGAGRLIGQSGWKRYLAAVHLGVIAFKHHRGRVFEVLAAGLGFQFLQCVSVYAAGKALNIPQVTLLAALAFFPPTAIAQNLPFALGGLGIREAVFVLFFGAIGVPDATAIALGLLVYLIFVAASLAGAPSFAFGRTGAIATKDLGET
ncbi:MAG: lysylphosphatidylglycerol synthase transmembrane domain-containing protein [Actinomycetes bacterium]